MFWKDSYQTIGVFVQIFVLATYTADFFFYVAADQYPSIVE